MTFATGRMAAADLLTRLIATINTPDRADVILDSLIGFGEDGVSAVVHTPSGDRYSLAVKWLGDREASAR